MPFRLSSVELHEAAAFQRRQQAVHRGRREPGADRQIAQAIALIVFGERFDDRERAIDGLHAGIAGIGRAVGAGFRLERFAPDHVSLHRDLHPSLTSDC